MGMELDWGADGMITVEAEDFQKETKALFGYAYTDDKMQNLREVFMHAKKLKLFRLCRFLLHIPPSFSRYIPIVP